MFVIQRPVSYLSATRKKLPLDKMVTVFVL